MTRLPDYVSTPSYICRRWPSGAYLLVCIDPVMEPRRNFHVAASCGYFALGRMRRNGFGGDFNRSFQWDVRCEPYNGFDLKEALNDEAFYDLLPPGAVGPEWRLVGVNCKVTMLPSGVKFRWKKPWFDCTRVIMWSATEVKVTDRWLGIKKSVRRWAV